MRFTLLTPPPPILKVPTLIGWDFFTCSPIENRNDVASVAPWTACFTARFPQIPLSVISRDASARDATSSIFNDLQAAGSISNLVGRWGIEKRIGTLCQNSRGLPPRIPLCPCGARPDLGPLRQTLGCESESRAIPTTESCSGKNPGIPCPFTNCAANSWLDR